MEIALIIGAGGCKEVGVYTSLNDLSRTTITNYNSSRIIYYYTILYYDVLHMDACFLHSSLLQRIQPTHVAGTWSQITLFCSGWSWACLRG